MNCKFSSILPQQFFITATSVASEGGVQQGISLVREGPSYLLKMLKNLFANIKSTDC